MSLPQSVLEAPGPATLLQPRVLLVHGERTIRAALETGLARAGCVVEALEDSASAVARIDAAPPEVVVLDLASAGRPAAETLRRARRVLPELPVIVLAEYGALDHALEAMNAGAHDFLVAPIDEERLGIAVRNAATVGRLARELHDLKLELRAQHRLAGIVGADGGLAQAARLAEKVTPTDLPVLLQGEAGVGKELFARAIHYEGPRGDRPFVVVSCEGLPQQLLDAELFGCEDVAAAGAPGARRGRFETADGGAILLDDVDALSAPLQARLLAALRDRCVRRAGGAEPIPVDVRVLASTRRDLHEETLAGRFLEDLYYRLSVFPIVIPPLRERREDIPALVRRLLAAGRGTSGPAITPSALEMLESHDWPGNVRELKNVLRRAQLLAGQGVIRPEHLPPVLHEPAGGAFAGRGPSSGRRAAVDSRLSLEDIEREHIARVIEQHGGNLSAAARALGIGRTTLYRKLDRFGLSTTGAA